MKILEKLKNRFLVSLVLVIALIIWRKLPEFAIRGDGFVYLVNLYQDKFWNSNYPIRSFETAAFLYGNILVKLFGVQIPGYFWVELAIMMFINIIFFWLIFTLVKNRFIAFAATLMLALNYFGNFDMYAGGIYAYFLERVPNMLFLLPSFLFLHLFLEQGKFRYYLISLVFFVLGVAPAHWSVLFTGPYLFYPFFWQLFKKEKGSKFIKVILIGLSYLAISGFFIYLQENFIPGMGPHKWTFTEFLFNPQKFEWPRLMLRQLTYWSEYPTLIQGVFNNSRNASLPILYITNVKDAIFLAPFILVVYIMIAIFTYLVLPKLRALLLTAIFATASIFYLNAFFGQYLIETQPAANRYLYLPTYLLVIFWSLFLWALVVRFKKIGLIISCFILIGYSLINYWLISTEIERLLERHRVTNKIWNFIVDNRPSVEKNSTVIIPNFEVGRYEALFLTERLGGSGIAYLADAEGWEKEATITAHLRRVKYDKNCQCVSEIKLR